MADTMTAADFAVLEAQRDIVAEKVYAAVVLLTRILIIINLKINIPISCMEIK